jgi:hypothetical protein
LEFVVESGMVIDMHPLQINARLKLTTTESNMEIDTHPHPEFIVESGMENTNR